MEHHGVGEHEGDKEDNYDWEDTGDLWLLLQEDVCQPKPCPALWYEAIKQILDSPSVYLSDNDSSGQWNRRHIKTIPRAEQKT